MVNNFRCFGEGKDFYEDYHDNEWGVPVYDDNKLFEMLILEGAQAGLNWEMVLKRRQSYREAFYNFDPHKVADMTDEELENLLIKSPKTANKDNPPIIKNRLKVISARKNARAFIEIQKEFLTFSNFIWSYVNDKPIVNSWKTHSEVPVETYTSECISQALRNRGMTFVGPVIMYSFMQAVGMVNDHLVDCWCRERLL